MTTELHEVLRKFDGPDGEYIPGRLVDASRWRLRNRLVDSRFITVFVGEHVEFDGTLWANEDAAYREIQRRERLGLLIGSREVTRVTEEPSEDDSAPKTHPKDRARQRAS